MLNIVSVKNSLPVAEYETAKAEVAKVQLAFVGNVRQWAVRCWRKRNGFPLNFV